MITTITILSVILICSFVFNLLLFNQKVKLDSENKKIKNDTQIEYNSLNNRQGFFDSTFQLNSNGETHPYAYRIYVEEIEKYNNVYSKLKLKNVNIIHGYSTLHYEHIKNHAKSDFLEIDDTDKFTWLERETDIIENRKKKLERVLK